MASHFLEHHRHVDRATIGIVMRLRVGNYRVLYIVDDAKKRIEVISVADRKRGLSITAGSSATAKDTKGYSHKPRLLVGGEMIETKNRKGVPKVAFLSNCARYP